MGGKEYFQVQGALHLTCVSILEVVIAIFHINEVNPLNESFLVKDIFKQTLFLILWLLGICPSA